MRSSLALGALLAAVPVAGFYAGAGPAPAVARMGGLAAPVAVELDGKPLGLGYPFLGDLDGDGRPDLLMGGDGDGRLLVFRGAPRPGAPRWFDERVPTGRVPRGCAAAYFGPQLVDFDGDGRPDLLSGSHCCDWYGFHVVRRTGPDSWAPREHRRVSPDSKFAGFFVHRSTVTAADWNGDGVPDLLWRTGGGMHVGVALGPFRGDAPLDVAHEIDFAPRPTVPGDEAVCDMTVADWDGDGRPDLFVRQHLGGGKGGIYWFRNRGGPGLKNLAPGELLLGDRDLYGTDPKTRTVDGFCVGDWDGDGRPDLILTRQDLTPPTPTGAWRGSVWLYRRL